VPSLLEPMNIEPSGQQRGNSLLEVVIAAVIFSTALVFMIGLWATYHSALTQAKNRLVASSLARSVLEQRLASGYGALTAIIDTPQVQTVSSRSQVRGRVVSVNFTTTFLTTESAASPLFRRLVATVEWEEDSGKKSLSYETCLFKSD
jgi:Tfp pilus assembly protein PilV